MSDAKIEDCTFLRLFEEMNISKIEIPRIQRDYAQGRKDATGKMPKLEALLKDIKDAVTEKKTLSLNFVYGKITQNGGQVFVPMDGQQRLTLLFLLHVYVFYREGKRTELLNKFSYEARDTSKIFVQELVENRKEVFESQKPPRDVITDSAWFITHWKYDPTIDSMLNAMNKIKEYFPDSEPLSEALQNNIVMFKFLPMDNFGLEDSLYIKLNARGKPLTDFEIFRSKLIRRLRVLQEKKEFVEFSKHFPGGFVRCFELHLDGDWTDMFWNLSREIADEIKNSKDRRERKKIAPSLDDLFSRTINNILMNRFISLKGKGNEDEVEFDVESQLDEIDREAFIELFYTLQALRAATLMNDPNLRGCVTTGGTYEDRVLLYALTVYACGTWEQIHDNKEEWNNSFIDWEKSFKKWFRVFKNLTLNMINIEKSDFFNMIKTIKERFSEKCGNVQEFLAVQKEINSKKNDYTGFSPTQLNEEILKARLILKREHDFESVILKAEKNRYFSGQIIGILNFSGLTFGTDLDAESAEVLEEKLAKLKSYSDLLDELFHKSDPVTKVSGALLRRALLTFTDENIPLKYGTLVAENPNRSWIKSWKDILAESENPYRPCFKSLFDELLRRHENHDIEEALKAIIDRAVLKNDEKKNWLRFLIDPVIANGLFGGSEKYINSSYWGIKKYKGRILLLVAKNANGNHFDLESLALTMLINYRKGSSEVYVLSDTKYHLDQIAVKGIELPSGEKLCVKCSSPTEGDSYLTVEREGGSPPSVVFDGRDVDDVLEYLENVGYLAKQ